MHVIQQKGNISFVQLLYSNDLMVSSLLQRHCCTVLLKVESSCPDTEAVINILNWLMRCAIMYAALDLTSAFKKNVISLFNMIFVGKNSHLELVMTI